MKENLLIVLTASLLSITGFAQKPWDQGELEVSSNGHYLQHEDGSPFFYMGCTAWCLATDLTQSDAQKYLDHRQANGYNVILSSLWMSFRDENAYGEKHWVNGNFSSPNEAYFQHVDWLIGQMEQRGLYFCINPAWANTGLGGTIQNFTTSQAQAYGEFLGARYKDKKNVLWFIGGDGGNNRSQYEAFAQGLKNAGATQLISWHINHHTSSSSMYSNTTDVIDYHMSQSGHCCTNLEPELTEGDYALSPAMPTINAEPNYEDHPINWNSSNGYFEDHDVRKQAYWNVFAGAMGHVYGHHAVWQFYQGTPINSFLGAPRNGMYWDQALNRPGSLDMKHLVDLMNSRPYLSRMPDRSMITNGGGSGGTYVTVSRDESGSYAMIYIPNKNQSVELDLGKISGTTVQQWWFNPADGSAQNAGTFSNNGSSKSFTSPNGGADWILVLDDASRGFGEPSTPFENNAPPVASFTSNVTSGCGSLTVQFTDQSSNSPTSWSWDFGDGSTSDEQNPTHTFSGANDYTVMLTTSNEFGNDTETKTAWISVSKGEPYPVANGGPADNTIGMGDNFNANDLRGLFFNVHEDIVIESFFVYSAIEGIRTIEILSNASATGAEGQVTGTTLLTKDINIPTGNTRVDVNIEVPQGSNYFIKISGSLIDLYRNNSGLSYPYSITDDLGNHLVDITQSNAGSAPLDYYYYFYNWQVRKTGCAVVTGQLDQQQEKKIAVYPNPNKGAFTVDFGQPVVNGRIEMVNLLGKTVLNKTVNGRQISLNVSGFESGIYLLKINPTEDCLTRKIIVE